MLRYTYTASLIVTEKDCILCEMRADAEESGIERDRWCPVTIFRRYWLYNAPLTISRWRQIVNLSLRQKNL